LYKQSIGIEEGLRKMAEFVRSHPIPQAAECRASIEIADHLPPRWKEWLGLVASQVIQF
jgi:hypothetical protein